MTDSLRPLAVIQDSELASSKPPIEAIGAGNHAWRWVIPAAAKKDLRKELALLGFTALTLFPELDRVADMAKELLQ